MAVFTVLVCLVLGKASLLYSTFHTNWSFKLLYLIESKINHKK